jgi:hypothetical protein
MFYGFIMYRTTDADMDITSCALSCRRLSMGLNLLAWRTVSVLSSTHAPVFSPLLRSGADVLCVSATQDLDDERLSQKRNWCVNQPTEPIPARCYGSSIDMFFPMFQGNMADVAFALPKPARYM